MNNKVAIGLVAAIIILVGTFVFFNRPTQAPAPAVPSTVSTSTAAGTGPIATSTTVVPAIVVSKPAAAPAPKAPTMQSGKAQKVVVAFTAFDSVSLVSDQPRPIISGTANVATVSIVVDDQQGVGMAGSSDIPVVNGHWSYSAPQILSSGSYRVHLYGAGKVLDATLHVTLP